MPTLLVRAPQRTELIELYTHTHTHTYTHKHTHAHRYIVFSIYRESEKAGLKLNFQKTKIMASQPITSEQTYGKKMEADRFYFLGLQNHC